MAKRKRRKGRKGKGPRKGSGFERDISRMLSRWWTHGKREDVFWRSAGSGSRATSRGKRGLATKNSHGDIAATDMDGLPLLDLAVMSLKNGYHACHLSGLLDKPNKNKKYELEKWFAEVKKCWRLSGAFAWMLIHRRTARAMVVYMPWPLFREIEKEVGGEALVPCAAYDITTKNMPVLVMRLETFFRAVTPEVVKRIVKRV
jgi:hypothetical protein